ncbi:hypothetical protein V8B97DRAFT_1877509 [Scleroderma yunnanense]
MPFVPGGLRRASFDIEISIETFLRLPCCPAEEWQTFDKYAQRVKVLRSADPRCAWMDGTRLTYSKLAALRARDGVDLFPNLRSIVCFLSEPGLRDEKLLPSSLRSLTSFVMGYEVEVEGHTNTLLQLAHTPLLEQFNLRGLFRSLVTDHVQPLKLAYLREVDLTRAFISSRDFQCLCAVLCESPITVLSIHLRHPLVDWRPALSVFPSLRQLTFCGDPSIAQSFLERLPKSTLADFTIEHEDVGVYLSPYESLLGVLHEKFANSLKSIYLNFGQQPMDIHPHYFLLRSLVALCPLVDAGLEELRYSMPLHMPTLPEELRPVLDPSSWPKLRVFSFSTKSPRLSHRDLEETMRHWAPIFASFQPVRLGSSSFLGEDDANE